MIEFSFRRPDRLINMNDRDHWSIKGVKVKTWRHAAWVAALAHVPQKDRPLSPCLVSVRLPVTDSRRRDPANFTATIKPIVDGMVDAGVWPDDTPEYVKTEEPTFGRGQLVVVRLTPLEPALVPA